MGVDCSGVLGTSSLRYIAPRLTSEYRTGYRLCLGGIARLRSGQVNSICCLTISLLGNFGNLLLVAWAFLGPLLIPLQTIFWLVRKVKKKKALVCPRMIFGSMWREKLKSL